VRQGVVGSWAANMSEWGVSRYCAWGPLGKSAPPDREHMSYTGDVPGTLHQQPYITVYHCWRML